MPLIVKIKYGSEIRRFTLQDPIAFSVLCRTLTELFPHNNALFSDSYTIKYFDDEGDLVSIESDEELQEGGRLAKSHNNVLRLELFVKRDHAKTNPSRPIREEAVEKSESISIDSISALEDSLQPLTDSIQCSSIYASQLPVLPQTLKRAAANEAAPAPESKKQKLDSLTQSKRGALTQSCAAMSTLIKDECLLLSTQIASDCNTAAELTSSQCRASSEQTVFECREQGQTYHDLATRTSTHCQQLSQQTSRECERAVNATSQLSRAQSNSTSQQTQDLSTQIARLMLAEQPADLEQARLVKDLSSQTKADCLKHADSIVATIMAL